MHDALIAQGIIERFSDLLEPEERVAIATAGLGAPLDEALAGRLVEHFAARKPRDERSAHEKAWATRKAKAGARATPLPAELEGWHVDEVIECLLGLKDGGLELGQRLMTAAGGEKKAYGSVSVGNGWERHGGVPMTKAWSKLSPEDRTSIIAAARKNGLIQGDPERPDKLTLTFHPKAQGLSHLAHQATRLAHDSDEYSGEDEKQRAHGDAAGAHLEALQEAAKFGDSRGREHHYAMYVYHGDRVNENHDNLDLYKHLETHLEDLGKRGGLPATATDPIARNKEKRENRWKKVQPGLEFKYQGMDARVDHFVTPDLAYVYTKTPQGAWTAYAKVHRGEIADIAGFRADDEEVEFFAAGGKKGGDAESHKKAWATRKSGKPPESNDVEMHNLSSKAIASSKVARKDYYNNYHSHDAHKRAAEHAESLGEGDLAKYHRDEQKRHMGVVEEISKKQRAAMAAGDAKELAKAASKEAHGHTKKAFSLAGHKQAAHAHGKAADAHARVIRDMDKNDPARSKHAEKVREHGRYADAHDRAWFNKQNSPLSIDSVT